MCVFALKRCLPNKSQSDLFCKKCCLLFVQWQHDASLGFLASMLMWHTDFQWHQHYEANYNVYRLTVNFRLCDSYVVWLQSVFAGEHSRGKWYVIQKCNKSKVRTLESGGTVTCQYLFFFSFLFFFVMPKQCWYIPSYKLICSENVYSDAFFLFKHLL